MNMPDTGGWGTTLDPDADSAVEKYANDICDWVSKNYPDKKIETHDDLVNNTAETKHSRRIYVKTDLGCVIILPNFVKASAAAVVVNLGLARAMSMEGFTEEYIDEHGKILSDPIPYKKSNVEKLGYYLTHRLTDKS